ncbi:hypothetical protein OG389_36290 (plasmid) [Streptomyces sp. NBC_00435]|uniref:hypothetical protein n=1 Tax=Streptomyces sp. NBC_00435 TaxID=2903649 RepID=UPI002E24595A
MSRPAVRYARARAIRRAHAEAGAAPRSPFPAPVLLPGVAGARAGFAVRAVLPDRAAVSAAPARATRSARAAVPVPAGALAPALAPASAEQEGPS